MQNKSEFKRWYQRFFLFFPAWSLGLHHWYIGFTIFYMEKCIFSNFLFVQFLVVKDTLNRMTKHDGVIGFMLFKITGGMAKIKVSSALQWILPFYLSGIPVKSTLSPGLTNQYAYLATAIVKEVIQVEIECLVYYWNQMWCNMRLWMSQAMSMIERQRSGDELTMLRIRTKRNEILIAPG